MTITQFIQNSPATAKGLFAKLVATTNGAVKTRESLFNELKSELELLARLEEEHLFPVLRKHKEAKDFVREAVEDNKKVRAMLAELEGAPKDTEEFLAKVIELRKAFKEHVRDEKKQLLPAVKTALSIEEAQAVTDRVEADKAAVDQERLQGAEEHRAAARAAREKVERRQAQAEEKKRLARVEEKRQQAEIRAEQRRAREEENQRQAEAEAEQRRAREAGATLARTGAALVTGGQSVIATGAAAAQAGNEAALRNSQQVVGAVGNALEQTATLIVNTMQSYSDQARSAIESFEALADLPPVAANAAAETGKTWLGLMSRSAESRGRRSRELLRCFTPLQVTGVQSRYVSDTMQAWFEANTRMLAISADAYQGMMQPFARIPEGQDEARESA